MNGDHICFRITTGYTIFWPQKEWRYFWWIECIIIWGETYKLRGFCKYLLTYLLIPWRRVLFEQPTGLQLVKKFPAFHGTLMFITALTSVRHLFLSWANPIQSIYPHPTSCRSILILSTHLRLGLPSGLLPSGFPTKTLCTPLSSPIRATCPARLTIPLKIHLYLWPIEGSFKFYLLYHCEGLISNNRFVVMPLLRGGGERYVNMDQR